MEKKRKKEEKKKGKGRNEECEIGEKAVLGKKCRDCKRNVVKWVLVEKGHMELGIDS